MNKLLLLSGFVSTVTFGQISITDVNVQQANDQIVMSTLLDPALDYLSTGADYTWDFSGLVPTSQRSADFLPVSEASPLSNILFGIFAATAYKASYFNSSTDLPLAELTQGLPISVESISGFTRTTPTAETMVGWEFVFNGQGIPVKSDTIETRYHFPLEYGDSYTSRGYSYLNLEPLYDARWIQHRYRETEVDGWGSLTTPYGTFNTLRIHHRILESDSIYMVLDSTGFWIPIPVPETHEYEWRALEEREAVLRIRTTVLLGIEQVTAVEYRDNYIEGLGFNEQAVVTGLFPNPANEQVTIQSSEAVLSVALFNQQGMCVQQEQVISKDTGSGWQTPVATNALDAGMYFIRVTTASGTSTAVFVKQ